MKHVAFAELDWQPTKTPGMEKALLWRQGGGIWSQLVRLRAGTKYPLHRHEVWEQTFVMSGKFRLSGAVMEAGDFLMTEPGDSHDAEALEDSIVLMSFGRD